LQIYRLHHLYTNSTLFPFNAWEIALAPKSEIWLLCSDRVYNTELILIASIIVLATLSEI